MDRSAAAGPAPVDDSALDGNAIGGLLQEVFGTEMTGAVMRCATCGATGPLAETVVYLRAPGTVMRCRNCSSVLMVVVRQKGLNCVDLHGLS
jgi:DNA-directed RNA polymerase subunit RPC12/RpoP